MAADDTPTPITRRESNRLQRAPILAGRTRIAHHRLLIGRERKTGAMSPRELDLDGATECARLARECLLIAEVFDALTPQTDIGPEEMAALTNRLVEIEARCAQLVPADWLNYT